MGKKAATSGSSASAPQDAGAEAFWKALKKGNRPVIEEQLAAASDSERTKLLTTAHGKDDVPLIFAVAKGFDDVVEVLLRNGANVNVVEAKPAGRTPLLTACWASDDVIIQSLIRAGADLKAVDSTKQGVLHACCRLSARNICMYLFNLEATGELSGNQSIYRTPGDRLRALGQQDADGATPLHLALGEAPNDSTACDIAIEFLTFCKEAAPQMADEIRTVLSSQTKSHATPLHLLLSSGVENRATAALAMDLVELGAPLDVETVDGLSALHSAAADALTLTLAAIKAAGTVDLTGVVSRKTGDTLLHSALRADHPKKVIELLLRDLGKEQKKEFVQVENKEGKQAIHFALDFQEDEAVKMLVDAGADQTIVDNYEPDEDDDDEDEEEDDAAAAGDYSGHGKGTSNEELKAKAAEVYSKRIADAKARREAAEAAREAAEGLRQNSGDGEEEEDSPPQTRGGARGKASKKPKKPLAAPGGDDSDGEAEVAMTRPKKPKQREANFKTLHVCVLMIVVFSAILPVLDMMLSGKK